MIILMIHNEYRITGGEEVVVNLEKQMLEAKGHKVYLLQANNKELNDNPSFIGKVQLGINTIWSYKFYKETKRLINQYNPDIVHCHNTFPQISPSIYWAAKKMKKPVIQTVHNYRMICAKGTFFKDGEICIKCLESSKLNALSNTCYRNSVLATIPIVIMLKAHKLLGTFRNKVDRYIALTNFGEELLIKSGIKENKITVKPNFTKLLEINKPISNVKNIKDQFIYVGRISEEKGLEQLLSSFSTLQIDTQLVIIGEGELKPYLQQKYRSEKIIWKSKMERNELMPIIKESKALVAPSAWYEPFGMVLIEAFSLGVPVIAPSLGGFKDLITNQKNGLLYNPETKSELEQILYNFASYDSKNLLKYKERAFQTYIQFYTEERNYQSLINLYDEVLRLKGDEVY